MKKPVILREFDMFCNRNNVDVDIKFRSSVKEKEKENVPVYNFGVLWEINSIIHQIKSTCRCYKKLGTWVINSFKNNKIKYKKIQERKKNLQSSLENLEDTLQIISNIEDNLKFIKNEVIINITDIKKNLQNSIFEEKKSSNPILKKKLIKKIQHLRFLIKEIPLDKKEMFQKPETKHVII